MFKKDKHPDKINLVVGAYRDGNGKTFLLPSVDQAQRYIVDNKMDKEYADLSASMLVT